MFRPVGKPRVAEEIVQQLRGLILRGEYAVGDKLPPERKLAEELGVNRASLREAIKSLEHMGLVKTRQGDGTRVLDFMQTAGIELVSHLIPGDGMPNLDVLTDVLEFRRWFGRESARLAAERATAEDVKKLEAMADQASEPALDMNELL
ncbi:MAG TPA: GntR family transcriptional regulator, partial [Polyangia bacterium]